MNIQDYKKNRYWSNAANGVDLTPGHRREFLLEMMLKNAVCAEIGVCRGSFAGAILNETRPKKLHLIDPWYFDKQHANKSWGSNVRSQEFMDTLCAFVLDKFSAEISAGTVQVHRDTSHVAARDFSPDYFDWIYIDGNHSFDFVKRDLEVYLPLVKKNGFITGDDYEWKDHPVKRAVKDFLNKFGDRVKLVKVHKDQFIIQRLS